MSELKPCPKCTKCNGGSKTELVNTVDGVFFKCLWCEELSELSFSDISNTVANRIKAEDVRELKEYLYDEISYLNEIGELMDNYAEKLERGEI